MKKNEDISRVFEDMRSGHIMAVKYDKVSVKVTGLYV
jgi:hypothetical protein